MVNHTPVEKGTSFPTYTSHILCWCEPKYRPFADRVSFKHSFVDQEYICTCSCPHPLFLPPLIKPDYRRVFHLYSLLPMSSSECQICKDIFKVPLVVLSCCGTSRYYLRIILAIDNLSIARHQAMSFAMDVSAHGKMPPRPCALAPSVVIGSMMVIWFVSTRISVSFPSSDLNSWPRTYLSHPT